jgi:uncharacterized protein YkwD
MSRFRTTITLALAAVSLALVPGASASVVRAHEAAGCKNADTSALNASPAAMRSAVVCLINVQRSAHRLPALRASGRLDRSAQTWTDRMVDAGQFTHGTDFWNRITAVGYNWANVGENIATGFSTPRQVVDGWMGSTGHCQNILGAQFANVGTGVDTHHLAQYGPSTWTQDFGLPMGQHAPSHNSGAARGCPYRVS